MKNIIIFMVLAVLVGSVSAADCSSYFEDVVEARDEVIQDTQIMFLSFERMFDAAEELKDELDDFDNSEHLYDVTYELDTVLDKSADCLDDMNDLKNDLEDYDDENARSRGSLPASCYEVYLRYDDDHDDYNKDFRDIQKQWNDIAPLLNDLGVYQNYPEEHTIAEAESKIRSILNKLGDIVEDAESLGGVNISVGSTDVYSELECITMAETTLKNERGNWDAKCDARVANVTCEGTVCEEVDCDEDVAEERAKYVDCRTDLGVAQSKLDSINHEVEKCEDLRGEIERLTESNDKFDSKNTELMNNVTALQNRLNECNSKECVPECGPWFYVALGLFILLILGWLLAM